MIFSFLATRFGGLSCDLPPFPDTSVMGRPGQTYVNKPRGCVQAQRTLACVTSAKSVRIFAGSALRKAETLNFEIALL